MWREATELFKFLLRKRRRLSPRENSRFRERPHLWGVKGLSDETAEISEKTDDSLSLLRQKGILYHSISISCIMTVEIKGRGHQVGGVVGFFLTISTISIILRCYCRFHVVKNFGLDDWFALVAWIFFVFFSALAITGVYHGTGQHAVDLPPTEIPIGLKWWWACEPVYVLSNMALKFSIGVMLLRIAVSRAHKVIIYTVIVVMELYSTFFFLLFVLQCRPSNYFWTRYTGGTGSCINPNITVITTYVYSGISCWVDWVFAIIPVFLVWNLQMNIRTKISVGAILAIGAIASTATIVRIPYIKGLRNSADFLYATTDVAIWSTSETGIAITASSIATLRPLFRSFYSRSRLFGGSSSGRKNTNPWPASGLPAAGYIRSRGVEEYGLRGDVNKDVGVTTFIGADGDLERGQGEKKGRPSFSRVREGAGNLKRKGSVTAGWNSSESRLRDDNSSEEEMIGWEAEKKEGIRKTIITTKVAH